MLLLTFFFLWLFGAIVECKTIRYSVYDCDQDTVDNIINVSERIEKIACSDIKLEKVQWGDSVIKCDDISGNTMGWVMPRKNDPYNFIMMLEKNMTGFLRDNVIIHEFGHTLGLEHNCEAGAAMAPMVNTYAPQWFNFKELNQIRKNFPKNSRTCQNIINAFEYADYGSYRP